MAEREYGKEKAVMDVSKICVEKIKAMYIGEERTIAQIIMLHYEKRGYIWVMTESGENRVLSRDSGKTYLISELEMMDVLDRTKEYLKGERILDFGKWECMFVGLLYNLPFTVRK